MDSSVLLFLALPAIAVFVGALIAAVRTPTPIIQSSVQHFAGGVVFAAVSTELMPDVLKGNAPYASLIGFLAGVGTMFAMKLVTERLESEGEDASKSIVPRSGLPIGLIMAVAIDAVLDGFVIGIGFAAGVRQGIFVSLSLTLEMLFLGLAMAGTLSSQGKSRELVLTVGGALAVALGLAAVAGVSVFSSLSKTALTGMLAFGSATLLYLVTEELLVRAHEVAEETPLVTSLFFLGFAIVLGVQLFG